MKFFTLLLVLFLPIICLSQASGPVFNWKEKLISTGNNLQGMTVNNDGSAILVGYGRTFKKSIDEGLTWRNVDILMPEFDFLDMSIKGNVGYIASARTAIIDNPSSGEADVNVSGNILKTIDGGDTWITLSHSSFDQGDDTSTNPMATGCYNLDFQSVECVNDTIALVYCRWIDLSQGGKLARSAILKTIDGGKTWKAITKDLGSSVVTSIRSFGDDIFMGGNKIFYKGNIANDDLVDLYPVLDVGSDDNMYISGLKIYNNTELCVVTLADGIYTTKDKGVTYTKVNGVTGANDFLKISDNVMIEIGGSSASKATINGGTTWTACYPGKTCWEIGGIMNDSLIALTGGIIYKIAVADLNSGNYKWRSQTIHGTENLHKMHIFDENKALIVGYGNGFLSTSDKGVNWTDKTLPGYLIYGANYNFVSLSKGEDGASYASTRRMLLIDYPTSSSKSDEYLSGIIATSTDNWETWKILDNTKIGKSDPADVSKNPFATGCYSLDNYTIECVDASTAYLYADWNDSISNTEKTISHSRIFKTSDGGSNWSAISDDFGTTFIYDISFKGDTGYLAGNNKYLRTTDGGATFTDIYPKLTVGTDGNLIVNATQMINGKEIYVVTSTDGIFHSNDVGETYTKVGNNSGASDLVILDKNSFMAVGSSTKTKFTNDGGVNWKDCYPGSTIWVAGEVLNDSLYVLCKSSVYKIAVSDLSINTSIKDLTLSNSFKVYYGTTELELVSSDKTIDRCFVYSIDGKLVAITEPHAKSCKFSYSNFTPGIYILSVDAEGQRFTKKVIFK